MNERHKQQHGRTEGDEKEVSERDARVRDLTVSSYGSSQEQQTRTRERAGTHLDEAGEPTLAEAEELRRGERYED